jgi:hypothetical protein
MFGLKPVSTREPQYPLAVTGSYHGDKESRLHRLLVFGGILLLVLLGLAVPALLAYYSLSFFAPGS